MSSYPYPTTTLRSTTPPLYYHRPEGTAPAYYTVPTRDVEGLRIPTSGERPSVATAAAPAAVYPRLSATAAAPRLSTDRGYAMPAVVNPYAVPGGEATHVAAPAGRWSAQAAPPYPTLDPLTTRLAAVENEDAAVAAEEAALRAKLAELQAGRRRQDEEQLRLSHGWAEMLEKEERYYTEPLVDRRPDIAAREQQCAMLHERLQQAEAAAQHAEAQLQSTEYVLRQVESFAQERQRIQDGFQDIERRRRECVAKAERYFDVEAKRVVEGNKVLRKVDAQLQEMTRRGPLAQLQGRTGSPSTHGANTRAVSFAPDKSIVLDLGREDSAAPSTESTRSGGGLTSSYNDTYHSLTAETAAEGLGFAQTNEEGGDLGGTSIAFSLNDTKESLLLKRRKTELAAI